MNTTYHMVTKDSSSNMVSNDGQTLLIAYSTSGSNDLRFM